MDGDTFPPREASQRMAFSRTEAVKNATAGQFAARISRREGGMPPVAQLLRYSYFDYYYYYY
jgi:hypothetical protein